MEEIERLTWEQRETKKLNSQLEALEITIQQNQRLRLSVYEDLKIGLIDKAEYEYLRQGFTERIKDAKMAQQKLRGEKNALLAGLNDQQKFLASFRRYANIQILERNLVNVLIERIKVYSNHHIEVEFRYKDRFESVSEFLDMHGKDQVTVFERERV